LSASTDKAPNQKLTIAHCIPWAGQGGVEMATLRMAIATREKFRNVAFCLPEAVELRNSFDKAGIETVTYEPPEPSLRHVDKFYKESLAMARRIQAVGADIVHFSDMEAAYRNGFAALIARTKTICHIRLSMPRLSLRHRLGLMPVSNYIFVSQEAQQTFALSVSDRKARVVYDAIEIPEAIAKVDIDSVRTEFGIPDDCHIVGMVARVAPAKDYYTLAAAAVEVLEKHPNTRFFIVGDNSILDLNRQHYIEVAQKLRDLGIEDRFIFTGFRHDVPRLISAMDICVLSTHREGFPLSILEVMAMQKPVIATAVGGVPEIVIPGVTGYLHQHGDSKELAGEIMSLIEDPAMARQIGLSAYEHVRQNYSSQVFVDEISKAYFDVMRH
jgi:glycosyltransferase involved in cell wall biosynthesis